MTSPTAFPLSWPPGLPRTAERWPNASHMTLSSAALQVKDALHLFGYSTGDHVRDIMISSNVTLDRARPEDPGVAVYFVWRGARRCIACDHHPRPEDNLRAIYRLIDGWRAAMRECGDDVPIATPELLTVEAA